MKRFSITLSLCVSLFIGYVHIVFSGESVGIFPPPDQNTTVQKAQAASVISSASTSGNITFDDYPVNTNITNQYQTNGVVFASSFIELDNLPDIVYLSGDNESYPSPYGNGLNAAPITANFTAPTNFVEADPIYLDGGSTMTITVFDKNNAEIGSANGTARLRVSANGIMKAVFSFSNPIGVDDIAGIDNLRFIDPGLPGPLSVAAGQYGGFKTIINLPSSGTYPVELLARVWHPSSMTKSYPLIIMLHGQHKTCVYSIGNDGGLRFPCNNQYTNNVPNYLGYDYLGKQLASYGYIVVSLSANGVNALPANKQLNGQVRAELIQTHLNIWRDFNNGGGGGLFRGRVNLAKVGTFGHSRGGEGVARHYNYNKQQGSPYGIKAVLPLAPMNNGRHQINGVPLAVMLSYCDGDVSDLQGVRYFDDRRYTSTTDNAPKHTFLVMGANHNYFNTVWTYDPLNPAYGGADDWLNNPKASTDPQCGQKSANRLIPAVRQRATALAYVSAFFQAYLGQRSEFLPYLKGDLLPPPSAQTNQIHVSYHPGVLQRRTINTTMTGTQLTRNNLGGAVLKSNLTTYGLCGGALQSGVPYWQKCVRPSTNQREPHGWFKNALTKVYNPGMNQTILGWSTPGGLYYNAIPAASGNISGFTSLQFRAGVNFTDSRNFGIPTQDFKVWLMDSSNRWAYTTVSKYSRALFFPPGNPSLINNVVPKLTANTVRLPLGAFQGIDKTNIRYVVFEFTQKARGAITVTDLAFAN